VCIAIALGNHGVLQVLPLLVPVLLPQLAPLLLRRQRA
jgi:hypothetical protein